MVVLTSLLAAVACSHERPVGSTGEPGSAVVGTTETVYRGPLAVPGRHGAAGRVVACTTPVTGGNNAGSVYDNGETYGSSAEALALK